MAAPEETESLEQLSLELKSKKKKKKKVDITSLESDLAGLASVQPQNVTGHDGLPATDNSDSAPLSSTGGTSKEPMKDLVNETDLDLYLSTSKKKKKKAPKINELVAVESIDQPLQVSESPALSASAVVAPKPSETSPVSYDYSLPLKKRKRKADITFEGYHEVLAEEGVEVVKDDAMDGDDDIDLMDTSSWAGSDRDYTYDELLERVFNIMRQKNPSMVDRKTKLVMKPPQVMRVGAKRTSFANFTEICKLLHRQPKHLLAFLLAELGTNGSIDGNNQLIIKGRFQQKQIETVLRRYIKEYVTCHTCRSPDTSLQRENRLFFLQCGTCGSRCTVENVKSGFQAVTNRRAIRQQQ